MPVQIQILQEALARRQAGEVLALATVVRVEKPSSARPGDKAIITPDGRFQGWIGGSCAQPVVLREALNALREGAPRVIRLAPPEKHGTSPDGVIEVPLTCISGGIIEVYIEPFLPRPTLLAIGHLPVIKALARLGTVMEYGVVVAGLDIETQDYPTAERVVADLDFEALESDQNTYVVVASHGNYDEYALEWALRTEAPYVALVTSHRRGADVVETLRQAGISDPQLNRLKYPAGLDIGAATPEEIALSIITEIVQFRRTPASSRAEEPISLFDVVKVEEALDPICGMTVEIKTARFTSEYQEKMHYFCCLGCKTKFDKEPEKYANAL